MSPPSSKHAYVLVFGDEEPGLLEDDLSKAIGWMTETIKDLKKDGYLQGWRAQGLYEQARNMPRAGFSFVLDGIGKIACERRRVEL